MTDNIASTSDKKIVINSETQSSAEPAAKLEQDTAKQSGASQLKKEINGPKGLEPTRYGDWESKGRCYDF